MRLSCISLYYINLPHNYTFFRKIKIKIKDHKIPVRLNFHRNWMKLTQVMHVNIIQSCETYMYFINLPHNYALFQKIHKNQN